MGKADILTFGMEDREIDLTRKPGFLQNKRDNLPYGEDIRYWGETHDLRHTGSDMREWDEKGNRRVGIRVQLSLSLARRTINSYELLLM